MTTEDAGRLRDRVISRRTRPAAPDATCGCTNDEDTDVPFVMCSEHERRWGPLSKETLRSVVVDYERAIGEAEHDLDVALALLSQVA